MSSNIEKAMTKRAPAQNPGLSDQEVVDGAERMARVLLKAWGFDFTGEFVRDSSNPRAIAAWDTVVKMLEEYNGTDLASAVDNHEGERMQVIESAASTSAKPYRVDVHGGADLDNCPSVAVFKVDEAVASEIIKMSAVVRANNLHQVERFDHRAEFMQYDPETDPEDAQEAGDENFVRTECDVLVVAGDEFFFRAYVKHTDVGIKTGAQSIADLAAYFRIPFEASM